MFLLADSDLAFLVGMAGFAAGHVCYLVLFGRARGALIPALVYAVVLIVFLALIWDGLPAGLRIPMAGYSLLLTAMAYRSGVLGRYAATGGALFLLSDALIATGIADWPQFPAPGFWVMLTYVAAQLLLTLGRSPRPGRKPARGRTVKGVSASEISKDPHACAPPSSTPPRHTRRGGARLGDPAAHRCGAEGPAGLYLRQRPVGLPG